jgi:hypothetical protein
VAACSRHVEQAPCQSGKPLKILISVIGDLPYAGGKVENTVNIPT